MARKQHIAIFTTASLPWMTGTAVNPLFRAAYLAKAGDWEVTLVVPWLSKGDQLLVYPNKMKFSVPGEQEGYVRRWLEERIGLLPKFEIKFYPGKFSTEKRSILPAGDITQTVSDDKADIAVLEEPEHLTWYHHGRRWKNKFRKVIGVVHTNYLEYVKRERNGYIHAFLLKHINSWVTDIYCHKVIRLSAATQEVPRSIVCNVHGVNPKFIEIGKLKHQQISQREQAFFKGAYYIGKMVWSKGYTELLQLLQKHQKELSGLKMELYGSGEDSDEVKASAEKLNLDVRVYPGRDHGDSIFHEFPNCHMYNTEKEFVRLTMKALAEEPIPLSEELRHELSWEAATERFVRVADIAPIMSIKQHSPSPQYFMYISPDELKKNMEEASAFFHNAISGFETARCVFGAIPNTLQPDEQQCKELGWRLQE
ncbi:hypothetical protein OsJ_10273 [Oryza sativa Japonica Group]|uniref:Digalactosyldiacylglycerol synthase n=2 Tax=Oryza sativa subsp. japonica TaxID=39947 RepID=A3AGF0_ORYSJ|nr:hypothetical protein OsJ_10273 [Oryza sativa Japonica Group]